MAKIGNASDIERNDDKNYQKPDCRMNLWQKIIEKWKKPKGKIKKLHISIYKICQKMAKTKD